MAEPFLGEIHMFAGAYAPRGYAECLGQLIPIGQNDALYSLLGTMYGGDGRVNFGLPDLQGRLPVHVGTGQGLTVEWRQGVKKGNENISLTTDQLPAHSHAAKVSTNRADATSPVGALFGSVDGTANENLYIPLDPSGPTPNLTSMQDASLSSAGANGDHYNLMPYLAIRFAIAIAGTYPTRS